MKLVLEEIVSTDAGPNTAIVILSLTEKFKLIRIGVLSNVYWSVDTIVSSHDI